MKRMPNNFSNLIFSIIPTAFIFLILVSSCRPKKTILILGQNHNLEISPSKHLNQKTFTILYLYSTTYDRIPVEFKYTLRGDIHGNSYGFDLLLMGMTKASFYVDLVLVQGGKETILASTVFESSIEEKIAKDFNEGKKNLAAQQIVPFSKVVSGNDPETRKGDTLLLRIHLDPNVTGVGVLFTNDGKEKQSYITIPTVVVQ
ncbi:MAG: hypothetical protein WCE64_08200 [Bacteroidales bacterium]